MSRPSARVKRLLRSTELVGLACISSAHIYVLSVDPHGTQWPTERVILVETEQGGILKQPNGRLGLLYE